MKLKYMLSKAFYYRHQLAAILKSSTYTADSILLLSPSALKEQGIAVLSLDFDGVLSFQDEVMPLDTVTVWLQKACQVFSAKNVYILTNNPMPAREQFFSEHFPEITFIKMTQKKPHPEGLESIITQSGVAPDKVVLVDDRLTSGILAACMAGTKAIYIKKPYVNYRKKTLKELFFSVIRLLERGFCLVSR